MKKSVFSFLIGLGVITGANAADLDKITGSDLLLLDQYRYGVPGKTNQMKVPSGQLVTVIITVANPSDVDKLREGKFQVLSARGTSVILRINLNQLYELSALPYVKRISVSRPGTFYSDLQRSSTGLDRIQEDDSPLGMPLTGKGVITGLYDSGIDVNHINFANEKGKSRIGRFFNFIDEEGNFQTPDINKFLTDNEYAYHGTHVLGIMAGSYRGDMDYSIIDENGKSKIITGKSSFYGVAPESNIMAAAGPLTTVNILTGIENMVSTAQKAGKPSVINLSIGQQSGWHDGKSPESLYLSELGKESIIVVAAGNDGLKNNCVTHYFTDSQQEVKTLLLPPVGEGYAGAQGEIDVWGSSDEGYEVDLVIYDIGARRIVKSFPLNCNTDALPIYLTTSDAGNMFGDWHEEIFDLNFKSSYMAYLSGIHEENGRFNMVFRYSLAHARTSSQSRLLGIAVRGKEGDRCDIYHYSYDLTIGSNGISGWSDPSSRGTINDFACADNVIAVGSYNNRDSYSSLGGRITDFDSSLGMDKVGAISGFSSYGDRPDGVELPHVCAPGSGIISSFSSPYIESMEISPANMVAVYNDGKRDHYWGVESGTSMAAPFVSGVIALWLELCPELDVDRIKDVITNTSVKDDFVMSDPEPMRWGAGKIDPYEGALYILNNYLSGMENIKEDVGGDKLLIFPSDGGYEIYVPSQPVVDVTLYNISGMPVRSVHGESGIKLSTTGLTPGVYIISVPIKNGISNSKIIVR